MFEAAGVMVKVCVPPIVTVAVERVKVDAGIFKVKDAVEVPTVADPL
jgi:hypothetical protein